MKSLWCVLALSCVGCESAVTASDATADVREVTSDEGSADALDATMLTDVVGAPEARVDVRNDTAGDLAANDVPVEDVASPCPTERQRSCDGACLDVSGDDLRCGACDRRCEAGTQCENGACVRQCLYGESICGVCDDNRDGISNCGG